MGLLKKIFGRGTPDSLLDCFPNPRALVEYIRDSPDEVLASHFYYGEAPLVDGGSIPVLVLEELVFLTHVFNGAPGTGKTALNHLISAQALMRRRFRVISIDLKDGPSYRNLLRKVAEKAGLPIEFFALDRPSRLLNFWDQDIRRELSVEERTDIELAAFGLDSGPEDRRGQYYDRSAGFRDLQTNTLFPAIRSPREHYQALRSPDNRRLCGLTPEEFKTSNGLTVAVGRMISHDQLNGHSGNMPASVCDAAIRLDRTASTPGLTILSLPAASGVSLPQIVVGLWLRYYYRQLRALGGSAVPTLIVIDEAQVVLVSSLRICICQLREFRCGVHLSVQSLEDLERVEMRDLAMDASAVRVFTSINSIKTARYMSELSGQRTRLRHATGESKIQTDMGRNTYATARQKVEIDEPGITPNVTD